MTTRPVGHGFTGRHMLLTITAFFAVVITANVGMAVVAGTSWTGFVVRNSYVASQEFNGRVAAARAQANLGWTASLVIEGGEVRLTLLDRHGRDAPVRSASMVMRNPATDRRDRIIPLNPVDDGFQAPVDVTDGQWVVEIDAVTRDGSTWRDTRRIVLRDGSTQ